MIQSWRKSLYWLLLNCNEMYGCLKQWVIIGKLLVFLKKWYRVIFFNSSKKTPRILVNFLGQSGQLVENCIFPPPARLGLQAGLINKGNACGNVRKCETFVTTLKCLCIASIFTEIIIKLQKQAKFQNLILSILSLSSKVLTQKQAKNPKPN